jgi:hypothetical protein
MKATTKEIREAVEFMERLVILKSNRHRNLSDYGPVARRSRESFVNYCLRVRRNHYAKNHKLPRLKMRYT